jgi:hypothetical protein
MRPHHKDRVIGLQIILNHLSPPEIKKAARRQLKVLLDEIVSSTYVFNDRSISALGLLRMLEAWPHLAP